MTKEYFGTIGTDAEMWIKDDKKYIPAATFLPGMKHMPYACNGGGWLADGCAAEINIDPVPLHQDYSLLYKGINSVVDQLNAYIRDRVNNKYKTVIYPDATFDDSVNKNPKLYESGCSEVFDAWNLEICPPVDLKRSHNRWAGGDIHVGFEEISGPHFKEDCPKELWEKRALFIRMLDETIAMYEVINFPHPERNYVFGALGRYRPTWYGIEYKTVNNNWLTDEKHIKWVYETVGELQKQFISNVLPYKDELINVPASGNLMYVRMNWDSARAMKVLKSAGF